MQVAIHAGALFTDEGELLNLLKANAQIVGQNSTALWGFRAYRKVFRSALGPIGDRPPVQDTLGRIQKWVPDGRTFNRSILSSAEYIGEHSTVIMDGQFYPQAGKRMSQLDQLFSDASVELYVGLRNPGSYIPKVLMSLSPPERQRILETTDLSCLSWLTMIEDVRDLAPDVSITLWSNEDSPLIWGDIARALAGLPEDTPLEQEYAFLSSLVSDTGKQEIQSLVQQGRPPNDPALKDSLAKIFQEYVLQDAIEEEVDLPGWNEDVVTAFTELYEQDLARLQTMPDIRFLKP